MKSKHLLGIIFLLVIAALTLSACGSSQPPAGIPITSDGILEPNWVRIKPPKEMKDEICWAAFYTEGAGSASTSSSLNLCKSTATNTSHLPTLHPGNFPWNVTVNGSSQIWSVANESFEASTISDLAVKDSFTHLTVAYKILTTSPLTLEVIH